ncbi:alpha/beta-hydrolase-like protein [Bradyrhizobium oligotrophicum S58]|uniref:triacylglycerol lipase n=1 Tax=Bradyrhizobium oligotrophicum S58 TaxID=1245469 RepID=M4ZSX1_9BRAD|nr:alpha/beta-hydrolase-like protein [Bradyrhizobium oligotrophicum]BAM89380.1 alpha/beta-hydrolase-like protein [Bradyrhizobium oligotrophicum S58]
MSLNLKSRKIIFVHGIFGWGENELPLSYWGDALAQFAGSRFEAHEVKCGPVSSFHDRACEVFAQIKGGDFQYCGAAGVSNDPAKRSVVARSERRQVPPQPLLSDWSADNPVILVGHSAGAHTCLALQQLLARDFFGVGSSADWIEAVVCISGVLNGSTLTYMFGCDPVTGKLEQNPGRLIDAALALAMMVSGGPTPELWLEQWADRTAFVSGQDNLACDLTLSGCRAANAGFSTNPTTYYFSLVTSTPENRSVLGIELPVRYIGINPLLHATAIYQADRDDFSAGALPLPNWHTTSQLQIEAWRDNDGAVSAISQFLPFTHHPEPVGGEGFLSRVSIEKGKWYFERIENVVGRSFDHLDPAFGAKIKFGAAAAQRELYQKLAAFL